MRKIASISMDNRNDLFLSFYWMDVAMLVVVAFVVVLLKPIFDVKKLPIFG